MYRLMFLCCSDSRDFCLHESFNASCRLIGGAPPGGGGVAGGGGGSGSITVILMVSAIYGRMHMGRCVNGDFNIGCSKDVLTYFDSQCSSKPSCDVSIRNLVDIHPCQRDFMSYLEATYRCIEGRYHLFQLSKHIVLCIICRYRLFQLSKYIVSCIICR